MERSRASRYAMIVATFGIALGIGFVMQNGDAVASRLGVDTQDHAGSSAAEDLYIPVRATSGPHSRSGLIAPSPDMSAPDQQDGADAGCAIGFEATPSPAAMVALSLNAPCDPEALVVVQHQGMKFHAYTDVDGNLDVSVPALSKEAYFLATVGQAHGVVAITGVPDLGLYDRAVLQWRGETDMQLHALEFGANEGEAGHVWSASSRAPDAIATGDRGFLTRLGTNQSQAPMNVEVYTYPSGMSLADGDVSLHVRAAITKDNCGKSIAAQSIQLRPDQPPAARNLSMRMPACENAGEFLVLKNMFEDLTLASR